MDCGQSPVGAMFITKKMALLIVGFGHLLRSSISYSNLPAFRPGLVMHGPVRVTFIPEDLYRIFISLHLLL